MFPEPSCERYATLFDAGFLPQGLALLESLERHAGDFVLWVLCMDDAARAALTALDHPRLRLLSLADVETPGLLAVKPGRSRGEYCWTLTSFLPGAVFARDAQARRVTYLDADVFFLRSPAPIFAELDASARAVLITEHDFGPGYDQAERAGRFCVQFNTFTRSPGAAEVLAWWQARVLEWCFARAEPGRFGDQKYLDQWPTLFPDAVHVLQARHLAHGPWRYSAWPATARGDEAHVFMHFHQLRLYAGGLVRLFRGYRITPDRVRELYGPYLAALTRAWSRLDALGQAPRLPVRPGGARAAAERRALSFLDLEAWSRLLP